MLVFKRAIVLMALVAAACACIVWGWDQTAQRLVAPWGQTYWGRFWGFAAHWLGHGGVQIGVIVVVIALAHFYRQPGTRRFGFVALAVFAISGLAVQAMKLLIGRPRPALGGAVWEPLHFVVGSRMDSFPSGHVTTSFALAAALAARYPKTAPIGYGVAILIALGRVVGGSHFPSDVLAGAALGMLVGWLSYWRLTPRRQTLAPTASTSGKELVKWGG